MIIDLPQNVVTIATQNAQNKGMATNDYIAKLIEQDSSKTAHQIKGEMTAFYYNIEEMDKALQAPRVEVPKSALKDLDTFEKWLDGAF